MVLRPGSFIQNAVSIPVMAKCRIGHFVEAQILEAIEIDYIDESEVLSPADDIFHIDLLSFIFKSGNPETINDKGTLYRVPKYLFSLKTNHFVIYWNIFLFA